LALNQLGNRPAAIAHAEAALKIYEAIEAPAASETRNLLGKWRGEKTTGQGGDQIGLSGDRA